MATLARIEYDPRPDTTEDLRLVSCDDDNIGQYRVEWTAPYGDRENVPYGGVVEYAVKTSTSPIPESITESAWNGLGSFGGPAAVLPEGNQAWWVQASGLRYFRLKSKDANGHWSAVSNQLTFNADTAHAACDSAWYGGGGGGGGGGGEHEDPLRGPDVSSLRGMGDRSDLVGTGENSILNGTPTGTRGADLLRIAAVQNDDGLYLTHLRTTRKRGALVDGVKLLFVDHPVGTETFASGSRVVTGRRSMASQAVTEVGEDVTKLVNGTGRVFNAASAAAVTVSTPLDSPQTPLVIECGNGGLSGHAIVVESRSESGWHEIGAVYPRRVASATVIESVPPGPVRLRFTGYAHVRSVARLAEETAGVRSAWGRLESARSSSAGDVVAAIGAEDTASTALVGQDTLQADFSGPALGEGLIRSIFLGVQATPVAASAASRAAASQRLSLPTQFALYQNAPNPFRGATTIRLDLPVGRMVRLEIFDVSGRRVRTLVNHFVPAGRQSVVWNQRDDAGAELGAGVYFIRLQADTFRDRKKLILMP